MPAHDDDQDVEKRAYAQGRRDADVDARLLSHERRLNDGDKAFEKLRTEIQATRKELGGKLDEVIKAQDAREAVEADREEQVDKRAQKLFSRRTIQIAFGTIVVMLLGVMVSIVALIANSH